MAIKRFNITITGHVQGVGFRFATQKKANEFNIKGIVKNTNDGNVYIEAEGPDDKLNEFVKWCYCGPGSARIFNVCISETGVSNYRSFSIKY